MFDCISLLYCLYYTGDQYIEKLYFVAEDCTALAVTTTQPPETTTEAPTTKSNETTTEAPTTKSNETTTEASTTKSNETTTEASTTKGGTTMAPEPPTPKPGSPDTEIYTAQTTNGSTCLRIKAGIEFVIPYVSEKGVSR